MRLPTLEHVMKARLISIGLTTMLACGFAPSVAASSRRVFSEADCGHGISTSVILQSDVDCSAVNDSSLKVRADGISISLNGHVLKGHEQNDVIDTAGYSDITITDGTIEAATEGTAVHANYSHTVTISKIRFQGMSVSGVGVWAYAGGVWVSNCTFTGLNYGVYSLFSDVGISNSAFRSNRYGLSSVEDSRVGVVRSLFMNNDEDGVEIESADEVTIAATTADGNSFGFYIGSEGSGIVDVSGSYARNNEVFGFYIDRTYYDTDFTSLAYSVRNSTATGNGGDGFYLYAPGVVAFSGNIAERNGGDGVEFGNKEPAPVASASSNSARDNSGWGFRSSYAVAGSGNRASGNLLGNCLMVICKESKK